MSMQPPMMRSGGEPLDDDAPKQGAIGHLSADEELQQAVCSALIEATELDASDIEVRAANARVVLSGSVPSDREQRLALQLAEQHAGPGAVESDALRIAPGGLEAVQKASGAS